MNVRISLTVDLDEIPERVNTLLKESIKELTDLSKVQIPHIKDDNCVPTLNSIEYIKKCMLKIDRKLTDAYHITAGYNRAIAESKVIKESEEDNDSTDT